MYYTINKGRLYLNKLRRLKYNLENYSHKQNIESQQYFETYKLFKGQQWVWIRVEKKTQAVINLQSPDNNNEYKIIKDLIEHFPEIEVLDDQNNIMHKSLVNELDKLRDIVLKQH